MDRCVCNSEQNYILKMCKLYFMLYPSLFTSIIPEASESEIGCIFWADGPSLLQCLVTYFRQSLWWGGGGGSSFLLFVLLHDLVLF